MKREYAWHDVEKLWNLQYIYVCNGEKDPLFCLYFRSPGVKTFVYKKDLKAKDTQRTVEIYLDKNLQAVSCAFLTPLKVMKLGFTSHHIYDFRFIASCPVNLLVQFKLSRTICKFVHAHSTDCSTVLSETQEVLLWRQFQKCEKEVWFWWGINIWARTMFINGARVCRKGYIATIIWKFGTQIDFLCLLWLQKSSKKSFYRVCGLCCFHILLQTTF